ncbi:MAG: THUMP domain-containing protein [Desulfotignum sp.]|nr:THUMP domain-containing protein [Desulfotignum sp.]
MNRKTILQKGRGKIRKLAKLNYIYEKESRYFAQVSETAKLMGGEELTELGAKNLSLEFRGIWFTASKSDFYRITYQSRLLSRILIPLITFACPDKDTLYKEARKIRWEELMSAKHTFSITANVSESGITHSNFAGLRVKDAIADYFRDRTNRRPNVDPKNPDIIINVHIHRDTATVSLDASLGPLHKRGYREASVSAPMQETVAAAIIRRSGWDGTIPLYDPMCGSGTLLAEALMMYCRIPAQVFRTRFGFERLPDFDSRLWEEIRLAAEQNIRPLPPGLIAGSDMSEQAVAAAKTNLMGLHHGADVTVTQTDFRDIPGIEDSLIVTNPPYGIRMGKDRDMKQFYQNLGMFLRERCRRSSALVYFGDPKYIKHVPLAPSWKEPLTIGGLDGKLVKYQLF